MRDLKNEIQNYINRIQSVLDSTHYKIEADRMSDIASDARLINKTINESDVINWDEE